MMLKFVSCKCKLFFVPPCMYRLFFIFTTKSTLFITRLLITEIPTKVNLKRSYKKNLKQSEAEQIWKWTASKLGQERCTREKTGVTEKHETLL